MTRTSKTDARDYVAYDHIVHAWTHVTLQFLLFVFVAGVCGFVVAWEASVFHACSDKAAITVTDATNLNIGYCLNSTAALTSADRQRLSQSEGCVSAVTTINNGVFHLTLDCIMDANLQHVGKCRNYSACVTVIHWIETLRNDLYLILILAIVIGLYLLHKAWAVGAKSVGSAVRITRQFRKSDSLLSPAPMLKDDPQEELDTMVVEPSSFRIDTQEDEGDGGAYPRKGFGIDM